MVLAGADVSLLDSHGRSALHYAVECGHLQLAENLIFDGADLCKDRMPMATSPFNFQPLIMTDDKVVCTPLLRQAAMKL